MAEPECGPAVARLPLPKGRLPTRRSRGAGLIRGEIDGPRRNHCVDAEMLGPLRGLLDGLGESAPVVAGDLVKHGAAS